MATDDKRKPPAAATAQPDPSRSVVDLWDDATKQRFDRAFSFNWSGDGAVLHIRCRQTGAAWALPRLPELRRSRAQLAESAAAVAKTLSDHLAALAAKKPS